MAEIRWRKSVGPAEIVKISVGRMDNNVYVLAYGDDVAVVDGGSNEGDFIIDHVGSRNFRAIFQTHNHGDHTVDLKSVVERTGAEVFAHPADELPVPAQPIDDGASLHPELSLTVLHTPGHTPGGVCFLLQEAGENHLFAGDTLFPGGPGNTFGNADAFRTIMKSLDEKLFVLPDDTHVYPGHGSDTTIGAERPSLEEWRARGW